MPTNDSAPANDPHSQPGSSWQASLLIVSSEPEIRDGLRTRLQLAGHEVHVAKPAEAALESALEHSPSLIVLDAASGDFDPAAFARRIKSADETRFVPLMLLTSESDPAAIVRLYHSGADDVRSKPIDLDELAARIQAQLKARLPFENLLDETLEIQAAYATQRDSGLLYYNLFNRSPLPIFTVDPETLTIKSACLEAAKLTGYSVETLIGMGVASLCPGEAGSNWLQNLCRRASSGGALAGETGSIIAADGSRIAVEAALRRVEYRNEAVVSLILTDLRPRNKAQEDRIEAERTNMLRETAIAVNSRINDPLFVILNDIGSLQTALQSTEGSIQSRLSRVFEAAQRIQRVTAQLSAISTVVTKEYLPGVRMLDLDESVAASGERTSENDHE
jgi:PAS domain S-box-containing protein